MRQLSWLKTKVGLFQDPRMIYLLNQPNGDTCFVVWFYLKDLAGMINDNGLVYVSANEPMTTALIAKALHRRNGCIEKALDVLERIDLIHRDETGIIQLLVWDDIQDYQKDERRRQQTRQRVARCRARKKEAQEPDTPAEVVTEPTRSDEVPTSKVQSADTARKGDTTAVSYYIQHVGQVNSLIGKRLMELTDDWGSEAVCRAIDIAHDNGANNINYIQAVLVNSNGQPKRKENPYVKREREFDEYVDEMLRKVNEQQFWEDAETTDDERNSAGYDSSASP